MATESSWPPAPVAPTRTQQFFGAPQVQAFSSPREVRSKVATAAMLRTPSETKCLPTSTKASPTVNTNIATTAVIQNASFPPEYDLPEDAIPQPVLDLCAPLVPQRPPDPQLSDVTSSQFPNAPDLIQCLPIPPFPLELNCSPPSDLVEDTIKKLPPPPSVHIPFPSTPPLPIPQFPSEKKIFPPPRRGKKNATVANIKPTRPAQFPTEVDLKQQQKPPSGMTMVYPSWWPVVVRPAPTVEVPPPRPPLPRNLSWNNYFPSNQVDVTTPGMTDTHEPECESLVVENDTDSPTEKVFVRVH